MIAKRSPCAGFILITAYGAVMEAQAYVSLTALSRRLGLPAAWLKAEAEADRVPHLRVGRKRLRLMFNVAEVEAVLLDLARTPSESPA